jgi:V/A-type H+/Na+-transporting ATPase subunit K
MLYFLIITLCIVIATITYGVVNRAKADIDGKAKVKRALKINLTAFVPVITAALIMMIPNIASAASTSGISSAAGIGYISAALSTGIACLGASYAVASIASSALGAVSENPDIFGKTLIYVGLGEGIAIYGLIISIMILTKL